MKSKNRDVLGTSLESLIDEKETTPIDAIEGSDMPADQDTTDNELTNSNSSSAPASPEHIDAAEVIIEDIEILHSFLEESKDHLENIEEKILNLEKTEDNDLIGAIFRSMHTMKGTSAFFGFNQIKSLSHSLESILDDLRTDKITLAPEIVDILLEGTDILSKRIDELDSQSGLSKDSQGQIRLPPSLIDINDILGRIFVMRNDETPETQAPETQAPTVKAEPVDDLSSLVTPEIMDNFISESTDLIDATEELILDLEKDPQNKEAVNGAFRCVHTMKGNAGFLGLSTFEQDCMDLENVLDSVRTNELQINQNTINKILSSLDLLGKSLKEGQDKENPEADESDSAEEEYHPLGEILVNMGAVSEDEIDDALEKQEKKLGEILLEEGKVSNAALKTALTKQTQNTASTSPVRSERKDIRVDMAKLDTLFDLMGELITAEAMVINNPELENIELDTFTTAANYLSKITREMQEITMTVRMIPLEGLFNKMKRLVRDLTKKFDKKINLVVSGQETEMDRNVMEEIADPLMHIIRNSIDHGVESQDARSAAGKDPAGTIQLKAKYEGNEIWITVKDDGNGLNREKILAKAKERGLLKTDENTIPDEEVWQLIFEAGFSTAAQVSEVSGRGVGMDVVKRNVEKLRGTIGITSETGMGTDFTLKIPLTLAIIDGITVKVGNVLYAIPLNDILEFVKAEKEQIVRTDKNRVVLKLRDGIIPVVELHDFFGSKGEKTEITEGILIVTYRNDKKATLLVDEIVGYHQIVVKSLPASLGSMRAISGCSILSNGEVSLIIDVGSLMLEEFE